MDLKRFVLSMKHGLNFVSHAPWPSATRSNRSSTAHQSLQISQRHSHASFRVFPHRRTRSVHRRLTASSPPCFSKASYKMMGRVGNLRSDNTGYCDFLMARPTSVLGYKHERIAEALLLTWLTHVDPNILGLRRVDERARGHRLAMVHIAIPLEYKRTQLAQALGIDQLADEKKTPRVNLIASAAWNEPHSYVRVQADFIISRVLGAIKERIMRPNEASRHTIQIPLDHAQTLARSRPDQRDENSRLRSSVRQAMALRNASIEPHQIQIMTHRATGEKWVRIIDVDRSHRTTLRLAIKRAGISTSVEYKDEVEGSDWSIRFAAAEVSKLFPPPPDSFDVHAELQTLAKKPVQDVNQGSNLGTSRMDRQTSRAATAASASQQRIRSLPRMVS